ncbi:MAG TPA: phosphate regulon transcriptional regulator PhoB [Hyphomicrobiaceae bacterium]|nr:phosphate regulon transcriptional regulator PhoB [Hyphomicrobiaceae bacterium]
MPPRILIIEDDAALTTLLDYNLQSAGYSVTTAPSAEDGELALSEDLFDLIILDWMLPEMSGIEFCGRLRRSGKAGNIPILMLTARGEEADRVRGLTTGADDYVVKPFSVPELLARVKSLLRRSAPERVSETLVAGDIKLDRAAHRVTRGSREVSIGPTEFRLLEALLESTGRVLSRAQLLDRVWGTTAEIDERTIDVHVGRLRKVLVRGSESDPIRTVRGAGYKLEID